MVKRVLIVDDEPKVGFFLSKALKLSDETLEVNVAASGEAALAHLEHTPVDVLVTDLRMPGIDGIELIKHVRLHYPKVRTVLITAYGNDKAKEVASRLQIYRYLNKPFNVTKFTQMIVEAVHHIEDKPPNIVMFSDKTFELISRQLESFSKMIGSMCVVLADMQGQRLVTVGEAGGIDMATTLALLSGGFVATSELARQIDKGPATDFNFHVGTHHDIYSVNVGESLFLAMLYDRRVKSSRIGFVWLYTRRLVDELIEVLERAKKDGSHAILDSDFSESLQSELDRLF